MTANIFASLRAGGYHYEPVFGTEDDGGRKLVELARALGTLFVAADMDPDLPVLVTEPATDAPDWRPFDRPERIGWHNDFSTLEERPVLSLAWIARADPEPGLGDWRAASSRAVLARLAEDPEVEQLGREPRPFGYLDGEHASLLPVIPPLAKGEGLRFYGRALREGARLRLGTVPLETEQLIAAVEAAADAVGETLPCTEHALLVCHNGLALHDRTEQTTTGPGTRRKSILCFLARLHEPWLAGRPTGKDEGRDSV